MIQSANNKYISKLTDEDIKLILKSCNYKLLDNLKDREENPLSAIERFEGEKDVNKIMIRCTALQEKDEALDLISKIGEKHPDIAKKLLTLSFLSMGSPNRSKNAIIFIEDFVAYIPFELDETYPETQKINDAYLNFCVNKFGKKYINDYIKYRKEIIAKENDKTCEEMTK